MMRSIVLSSFLGADWKFLALVVGIKSASAIYSCIWRTCPSHERHDVTMAWSVQDKQRGARTIEDIKELAKVKKRGVEKLGCVRQPLFPSIPIDHIIPDVLHLFLRICDVLINLLILELWQLDGIDKNVLRNFDRSTATHVAQYEK